MVAGDLDMWEIMDDEWWLTMPGLNDLVFLCEQWLRKLFCISDISDVSTYMPGLLEVSCECQSSLFQKFKAANKNSYVHKPEINFWRLLSCCLNRSVFKIVAKWGKSVMKEWERGFLVKTGIQIVVVVCLFVCLPLIVDDCWHCCLFTTDCLNKG